LLQKELFMGKIGSLDGVLSIFEPKKATKKGLAVKKSNHFDSPPAAQKKLASESVRAFGPLDS